MANMTAAGAGVDLMEARYTEAELGAMTSPVSPAGHHAPSFAEYLYWAERKRAEEDADTSQVLLPSCYRRPLTWFEYSVVASQGWGRLIQFARNRNKNKSKTLPTDSSAVNEKFGKNEKDISINESQVDEYSGMSEHDRELLTARRVLRQAGWATVFYLVTWLVFYSLFYI